MAWHRTALGTLAAVTIGCAAPTPPPALVVSPAPSTTILKPAPSPARPIALLEPYLVAEALPRLPPPPSPLGGRIVPIEPALPLSPAPQTQIRPIAPPPVVKPAPTTPRAPSASPALVRLFEEERQRAVDVATRNAATAAARVTQTTAEAKKTWDLVRAGALAQFKADQADAATRAAASEKAEADRILDEAQDRRRNARRDVEAALGAAASLRLPTDVSLAQADVALPTFRALPYTYRVSVLGPTVPAVKTIGGTLGRPLPLGKGEGGAWLVTCLDPAKLRVQVGALEAQVVPRSLPPPATPPRRA